MAALQGVVDGRAVEAKKLDLTTGSAGSVRVVAQARRLDGLFGAAQLRPDPADAFFRQVKMIDSAIGTTLQRRRVRVESEKPTDSSMMNWLDRGRCGRNYVEYANIQYDENKKRAEDIIQKIVDSLNTSASSSAAQILTYCEPDSSEWVVLPDRAVSRSQSQLSA